MWCVICNSQFAVLIVWFQFMIWGRQHAKQNESKMKLEDFQSFLSVQIWFLSPFLRAINRQIVWATTQSKRHTTVSATAQATMINLHLCEGTLHSKSYRTCRVTMAALCCAFSMVASSLHAVRNNGFQKCSHKRLLKPDTSLASPLHRFDPGTWTRLREGQSPNRTRQLYLALA